MKTLLVFTRSKYISFIVLLLVVISLNNCSNLELDGCNSNIPETMEFAPWSVQPSFSEIRFILDLEYHYLAVDGGYENGGGCREIQCSPDDIQYSLYAKSKTEGSLETLVESGRVPRMNGQYQIGGCYNCIYYTLSFATPAFTDFRLIMEIENPDCADDPPSFNTYEYIFSTGLDAGDQSIVYDPSTTTVTTATTTTSPTPTITGLGNPPFTFTLDNGSELPSTGITIDSQTGVIATTAAFATTFGNNTYSFDVYVTNGIEFFIQNNAYTLIVNIP